MVNPSVQYCCDVGVMKPSVQYYCDVGVVNPSVKHYCDVWVVNPSLQCYCNVGGVSGRLSIGPTWCRETKSLRRLSAWSLFQPAIRRCKKIFRCRKNASRTIWWLSRKGIHTEGITCYKCIPNNLMTKQEWYPHGMSFISAEDYVKLKPHVNSQPTGKSTDFE